MKKTMKAILIEKHANNKKTDNQAIKSMLRMRYALHSNKPTPVRYYVVFMTKKGRKKFQVEAKEYHSLKIDSLGNLTIEKNKFISFEFHKIATKNDVEQLRW